MLFTNEINLIDETRDGVNNKVRAIEAYNKV